MNDGFVSPSDEQQNQTHTSAGQWAAGVTMCEDRQDADDLAPRPDRVLARRRAALAAAGFALALGVLAGMPAGPLGAAATPTVASR